ncbi:MAG TPA: hypothetical protein EYP32_00995 [Aquificaceae bacterium]|nr:hypothetical protein [Aquificaceae bacterium]
MGIRIDDIRNRLKEYCQFLGIPKDKTEKILRHEYATLTLGKWKTKTRNVKEGMQLQGVLGNKKVNLKNTTREELFKAMRELVKLYRAYKFFTEEWQETKRRRKKRFSSRKCPM